MISAPLPFPVVDQKPERATDHRAYGRITMASGVARVWPAVKQANGKPDDRE
ncbi:MAG: hypothetical protein ABJE10_19705 [bacterium]